MDLLKLEIRGIKSLQKKIEKSANGLSRMRTANKQAATVLWRLIIKNFESEGKDIQGGGGWQKLAPSTLGAIARTNRGGKGKRKVAIDRRPKILQDTGFLKGKWQFIVGDNKAVLRSGVDYGIYHDEDGPRTNLPQRMILPRPKQANELILKVYKNFVKENLP